MSYCSIPYLPYLVKAKKKFFKLNLYLLSLISTHFIKKLCVCAYVPEFVYVPICVCMYVDTDEYEGQCLSQSLLSLFLDNGFLIKYEAHQFS